MSTAVILSLITVIILGAIQIAVIARWTGRIDGYIVASDKRFEAYIAANNLRMEMHEDEIRRLRDARHASDGIIQRHDGILRELERRQWTRRSTDLPVDGGD